MWLWQDPRLRLRKKSKTKLQKLWSSSALTDSSWLQTVDWACCLQIWSNKSWQTWKKLLMNFESYQYTYTVYIKLVENWNIWFTSISVGVCTKYLVCNREYSKLVSSYEAKTPYDICGAVLDSAATATYHHYHGKMKILSSDLILSQDTCLREVFN